MQWLQQKVVEPIINLLKQGITPERIALSIAVGVALGVFPVLGSTTVLCAVAALLLRLNLPAIQIVNWLVYPLQIVLLLPFIRMGEAIYRASPLPLNTAQLLALVRAGAWAATKQLWRSGIHAITAWTLVAPLGALVIYSVLAPLLRRARSQTEPQTGL
jgi:uncharacterized protein (DUF2062 family)